MNYLNQTPEDGEFYDIETCDGLVREAEFDFIADIFITKNGRKYSREEVTMFEKSA